jgi:hypothetical protein
MKDRPGAVVKSPHLCREVLGSTQPLHYIAGVRFASYNPSPDPTLCGSFQHWVCPLCSVVNIVLLIFYRLCWLVQFNVNECIEGSMFLCIELTFLYWSVSFPFLLFWATLQVAALQFGDFYNMQYVKMYTIFMMQMQVKCWVSVNYPLSSL